MKCTSVFLTGIRPHVLWRSVLTDFPPHHWYDISTHTICEMASPTMREIMSVYVSCRWYLVINSACRHGRIYLLVRRLDANSYSKWAPGVRLPDFINSIALTWHKKQRRGLYIYLFLRYHNFLNNAFKSSDNSSLDVLTQLDVLTVANCVHCSSILQEKLCMSARVSFVNSSFKILIVFCLDMQYYFITCLVTLCLNTSKPYVHFGGPFGMSWV